MAIRLYENFRALLYAPYFAAHALKAYDAEGVAVELLDSPNPGFGAQKVLEGAGDLTWGGPMRMLDINEHRTGVELVGFCEVVGRDPFSLVGRAPRPGFTVRDLAGLRLGSVSEVPTPWLCLQEDIRQAGMDPAALTRVADRSMADNLAALDAGTLDVVQLFEPYVSQALAAGHHLWLPGAARGLTAYTTFYTTRANFERHRADFALITQAMYRVQKWLHAQPAETIARTVQPYFASVAPDVLVKAMAHYKQVGIWNRDPVLKREGFDRLKAGLISGGLIKQGSSYEQCVDTSLAEQAIAADPPSM